MSIQNKVYLDHLIKRDSLLYTPSIEKSESQRNDNDKPYLEIKDLVAKDSLRLSWQNDLRKPDFQRSTSAWTPEDCVDLLEAVIEEQVVPSIILWRSPDKKVYVLDGGHRISVLLAWVLDDWGDGSKVGTHDENLRNSAYAAAKEVRNILDKRGIGSYEEWKEAYRIYIDLEEDNKEPELEMDTYQLKLANRYKKWTNSNIGFPILWVRGDYKTAERSFLKINKTGRRLSEWETKLVENRTSGFARAVMSLANPNDIKNYWPETDGRHAKQNPVLGKIVPEIIQKVSELKPLLFDPPYHSPVKESTQPLLAIPESRPDLKPAYLAELLTIISGKKGKKAEMEKLLKEYAGTNSSAIVNKGHEIVEDTLDVIRNIYGPYNGSLNLMPLVYFYNDQGVWVRSLLYGMLYWIAHTNDGSETNQDVFHRKLLFTKYRKSFEDILIANKDLVLTRLGRSIGSGPEVTYPTAKYFNGLLTLLIKHSGQSTDEKFLEDHRQMIEGLAQRKRTTVFQEKEKVSSGRVFTGLARQSVITAEFISSFQLCEICGGRYFPGLHTQVDHITPYSQGGQTKPSNGRNTHPFCNNNRSRIERILRGEELIPLPLFEDPDTQPKPKQLSFLLDEEEEDD